MSKTNRTCIVYRGYEAVEIDPKITFPLFNELIEKDIKFEFVNESNNSKGIKYWFYIDRPNIIDVKKIVIKLEGNKNE